MRDADPLQILMARGARIHAPDSVEIGPEVDLSRIQAQGLTIYPGCRIYGAETVIQQGVELGAEGPVTIRNCALGRDVRLKAGTFEGACFLQGARMGPGAQVREGCLLEEGARGAHNVGIKQTILFPFVTLGSLINFCDCLMAGGTDEKNHSEVGSSYIHFNYTPNQDKATASLIGDVPKGVMINQPPIFLGGQGGMVGPVRIAYGVVVAAGTIVRKDLLEENKMVLGSSIPARSVPFHQGLYTNIKRILEMNILYIANLVALRRWYLDVRSLFFASTHIEDGLFKGALRVLDSAISERIKRLGQVASRMPASIELYRKTKGLLSDQDPLIKRKLAFHKRWEQVRDVLQKGLDETGEESLRDRFLEAVQDGIWRRGRDYLSVIKGFTPDESHSGTRWLQGVVDRVVEHAWDCLPEFKVERKR